MHLLQRWCDTLIFGKNKGTADAVIQDLQTKFTLPEEGDILAYLEVKVEIDPGTDSISLIQPYLIQRIIDEMGNAIAEANTKDTPTVYKEILHKDTNGLDQKQL